jgi:hypothetical protein
MFIVQATGYSLAFQEANHYFFDASCFKLNTSFIALVINYEGTKVLLRCLVGPKFYFLNRYCFTSAMNSIPLESHYNSLSQVFFFVTRCAMSFCQLAIFSSDILSTHCINILLCQPGNKI